MSYKTEAMRSKTSLSGKIQRMVNNEYRQLALHDIEQAAQALAHSFMDDPLISFMLPFKTTRWRTLLKFFRAYGEVNIKNQRGFGVGDPLQGVAYWKFPNQDSISISVKSLGKFLPLLFTIYPIGYFRARKILEKIDSLHQQYANEPHFYLDNLGILAEARGKGLASKLIRPFLEMADQQKVIAYTDTVTESNVPLYQHFGFELMEASRVQGADITIYALRRSVR